MFGNDKISMILDYNRKANISSVTLNGQKIVEGDAGIYSSIRTKNVTYSTLELLSEPSAKVTNNTITVSAITYGDKTFSVNETWTFIITRRQPCRPAPESHRPVRRSPHPRNCFHQNHHRRHRHRHTPPPPATASRPRPPAAPDASDPTRQTACVYPLEMPERRATCERALDRNR